MATGATSDKRACRDCAHARTMQGTLFCQRFPPQVVALPVRISQITNEMAILPQARFPAVEAGAWCGEYVEGAKNRIMS